MSSLVTFGAYALRACPSNPSAYQIPRTRIRPRAYSSYGLPSIHPAQYAFAALKADGTLIAWGMSTYGGSGAPSGTGFTAISSTLRAFAALDASGTIHTWGNANTGGSGPPSGSGFTAIYSTQDAFAALKSDGSISSWGKSNHGGTGAPSGTGFVSIASTQWSFAALDGAGVVAVWGSADYGGDSSAAPSTSDLSALTSWDVHNRCHFQQIFVPPPSPPPPSPPPPSPPNRCSSITALDFYSSCATHGAPSQNNVGGLGPDTGGAEELRFPHIAVQPNGVPIDLVITVASGNGRPRMPSATPLMARKWSSRAAMLLP